VQHLLRLLRLFGHVTPRPSGVEAASAEEGGLERLRGGCRPAAAQLCAKLGGEALGLAPHALVVLAVGLEELSGVARHVQ